jgi:phosphate starvation-inducible PhoH-like protein
MVQKEIKADKIETILTLFGNYDENVNLIQREFDVVILGRGDNLTVSGEEKNVFEACEAIKSLITLIEKGETLTETTIRYVFSLVR